MNILLNLVVFTANILGIFTDPFEFEGDYGADVNATRQIVFEAVVSKEAMASHLSDFEIQELAGIQELDKDPAFLHSYRKLLVDQAIESDRKHGPLLSELAPLDFIETLKSKSQELKHVGLNNSDIDKIASFLERFGEKNIFYFLRHFPAQLLHLDKSLRDQAAQAGQPFDLPILGSTKRLEGKNSYTLKLALLHAVFNEENFKLVKDEEFIVQSFVNLSDAQMELILGSGATVNDLSVFCSPTGQLFFYWLYHSLNLHLAAADELMIEKVNEVKACFAESLGNPLHRAQSFKEKLIEANAAVVFTQESDAIVPQVLTEDGFFLPVDKQNPLDGTYIFLRSDFWEQNYKIIKFDNYPGYLKGRLNVILATTLDGQKFLLASGHGHSTLAEDGRLQISYVKEKFDQLLKLPVNDGLQLLIGIDANTKSEEDINKLRLHLDSLGLVGTKVGPTTIKRRMVTAQHAKAGIFAVDEEDYLITLKLENGGKFAFENLTVGFKKDKPDVRIPLPNIENPSDHYPVGAEMTRIKEIHTQT